MKLALITLLLACSLASADPLTDLEGRIFDGSTVTLSQTTIQDANVWPMFQDLARVPYINVTSASCSLKLTQKYLECTGTASLWHQTDGKFVVVFEEVASKTFDVAIQLSVSKTWTPKNIPMFPDSFVDQLGFESATGTVTLSNADFSAGELSFKKGMVIDLSGVDNDKDAFSLTKLCPDVTGTADLTVTLPFTSSWAFDFTSAEADLAVDANCPLKNMPSGTTDTLTASVVDLTSPTVNVDLIVHWKFPNIADVLTFELQGQWSTSAAELDLTVTMTGPINPAFGYKWLTVNTATGAATIDFNPPNLASLSLKMDCTAVFGAYSADVQAGLSFANNFENFLLEFSIDASSTTALDVVSTLVGSQQTSSASEILFKSGSADIGITNYNSMGKHSYVPGFNLYTSAQLMPGPLAISLQGIFPSGIDLGVVIQLNVASATLQDVFIELTLADMTLSKVVELKNIVASFDARPSSDITVKLSSDILCTTPDEPQGVLFDASASFQTSTTEVNLKGDLKSDWPHPLGAKWLDLQSASVSVDFTTTELKSLHIDMSMTVQWANEPTTAVQASFDAVNDFAGWDLSVTVDVKEGGSTGDMVRGVSGASGAITADDLVFNDATVTVTISTMDGAFPKGLSIDAKVTVTGSGLTHQLAALLSSGTADYECDLFVPIFSPDPLNGLSLTLKASSIKINDKMSFSGVVINLQLGVPSSIGLSGGMTVLFDTNPTPITFNVGCDISTDGEFSFEVGAQGTWDNLFGLKGLDVSNLWVQASFAPNPPFLVGFGAGGEVDMGDVTLKLNGHVDIDHPASIFFEGEVDNLSLKNLASAYNGWATHQINLNDVPDVITFDQIAFKFAPKDADIVIGTQTIHFTQGFSLTASAHFLSVDCATVSLQTTTDDGIPDLVIYMDLKFDNCPGSLVTRETSNDDTLLKLEELKIDDLDFVELAKGHLPSVHIYVKDIAGHHEAKEDLTLVKVVECIEKISDCVHF